jgi:hypothetical protein
MTILKLTEKTKKYFISSNLLHDDGIECPEWIANICAKLDDLQSFYDEIMKLKIDEFVELYDFLDEYCISKGVMKLVDRAISDIKFEVRMVEMRFIKDGINLILFNYGASIFENGTFDMTYGENLYNCTVTRVNNYTIIYKVLENDDDDFIMTFNKNEKTIIGVNDSMWGDFVKND